MSHVEIWILHDSKYNFVVSTFPQYDQSDGRYASPEFLLHKKAPHQLSVLLDDKHFCALLISAIASHGLT